MVSIKETSMSLSHPKRASLRLSADKFLSILPSGDLALDVGRMRQDATLRKLEITGQAVKNLSDDMRSVDCCEVRRSREAAPRRPVRRQLLLGDQERQEDADADRRDV